MEKYWNWYTHFYLTFLFVTCFKFPNNTYFASNADDNTPYTINQNTDFVIKQLGEPSISHFKLV